MGQAHVPPMTIVNGTIPPPVMPAIGPMGVPPFMGGFPGYGGMPPHMGAPFPGMYPGMSGPAMTGGSPFFPGAPGIPPMVNPSLNYLQNMLMK